MTYALKNGSKIITAIECTTDRHDWVEIPEQHGYTFKYKHFKCKNCPAAKIESK